MCDGVVDHRITMERVRLRKKNRMKSKKMRKMDLKAITTKKLAGLFRRRTK